MNNETSMQKQEHKLWPRLILALVVVTGLFSWAWYALSSDTQTNINSYEECVAAGYPVAESYPEQCMVPGGQTFTRQLSEEELRQGSDAPQYVSEKGVEVEVFVPQSDNQITSPLTVLGLVPGNWSFEASFGVELRDGEGNVITEAPAEVQGDWMTEELVPFVANLEFEPPGGGTGNLVLVKSNPSGLAENDDSVSISISFE